MNHKNEIEVYISIYGDLFDPEELTKLLQLQPRRTYIKGHEIPLRPGSKRIPGRPKPVYKETAWNYGSGEIHTYNSEDASKIVENAIKDKIHLINDFVQKHDLNVILSVVPYLDKRPTRSILGIRFSPSFTKILADLSAEISIDIYRI